MQGAQTALIFSIAASCVQWRSSLGHRKMKPSSWHCFRLCSAGPAKEGPGYWVHQSAKLTIHLTSIAFDEMQPSIRNARCAKCRIERLFDSFRNLLFLE